MIPEIMSQEELDPSANPSPENQSSAPQIIPNTPLPDPASWEHVVIALSPQKQEQLMKGIEHVESEEPRLSTWPIIARAISTALLSTPSGLYVQSSMQLHRKDFLLFTRTDSKRRDGTGGILEMHISNNHQGATWQGHWQQARPTIAHFLKESKLLSKTAFHIAWTDIGNSIQSFPKGGGKGRGKSRGQGSGDGRGKGSGDGRGKGSGDGRGKSSGKGRGRGRGKGRKEGRGEGRGEGKQNRR